MALRIFDYECEECGYVFEQMIHHNEADPLCEQCGGETKRLVSYGAASIQGEEAAWINTVKDVIARDTKDPTARKFLAEPTRTNLKSWMKTNNLRHLENGEVEAGRASRREAERQFEKGIADRLMRNRQQRIEL